ncbi:hypothetical protein QE152_g5748 [Popillia japonica]|uniref:Uncharacterized protein n=1 Tax=Popillia japonica TaxID=7064 RepID=A0AAW1ML70_POPJA
MAAWLASSELFDDGYFVYRRDRNPLGDNTRGRSVLIAVQNNVQSSLAKLPNTDAEPICVILAGNEYVAIVGAHILPPSPSFQEYTVVLHNIDFNLPGINWCVVDGKHSGNPSGYLECFVCDSLHLNRLLQCNYNTKINNVILDLV